MGLRRALVFLIAVVVGWWLFLDTYRRHAAVPDGSGEIRFVHFGSYEDFEFWRDVIADFQREHPGTHIRQEYVVGLGDQYNIKMRRQILSHTLPEVALIQLAPFHELAEHFENLDRMFGDVAQPNGKTGERPRERLSHFALRHSTFSKPPPLAKGGLGGVLEPTGLAAFRVGDVQRGLPISGGNLLIYANRTCFERAERFHGRPVPLPADDWTIEDFIRTAEMLTCDFDHDGRIDQFGFWLPRWVYFLPFIWSFGADVTDAAMTRWTFTGPQAENAMRFYRQLATGDRVCPRDEEVPQLFQDTGFLTGRTAMCVNGPWFMPFLAKTDLAEAYVVAPIPRGPCGRATRITWDGVVMRKDLPPQRRAIAWQFIEWMLSRDVQDRLARTGRALPARAESQAAFVAVDEARRRPFVEALSYSRLQSAAPPLAKGGLGGGTLDRIINRHFGDAADPARAFRAEAMLDALAGDREIVRALAAPEGKSP